MSDALLRVYVWQLGLRATPARRRPGGRPYDDRGEGVISAAIAVLIMAFLGAALWAGFKLTLDNTQTKVDDRISQIGN